MFSKTPRERPKVKKVGLELCKPKPGHSSENSSAVSPAPQSAMHGSGAPGYKPNPTTEYRSRRNGAKVSEKFTKSPSNCHKTFYTATESTLNRISIKDSSERTPGTHSKASKQGASPSLHPCSSHSLTLLPPTHSSQHRSTMSRN